MTGFDALMLFALLFAFLWVAPVFVAHSIGKPKNREGWLYGLALGWIGVLVLALRPPAQWSPARVPPPRRINGMVPAPISRGETMISALIADSESLLSKGDYRTCEPLEEAITRAVEAADAPALREVEIAARQMALIAPAYTSLRRPLLQQAERAKTLRATSSRRPTKHDDHPPTSKRQTTPGSGTPAARTDEPHMEQHDSYPSPTQPSATVTNVPDIHRDALRIVGERYARSEISQDEFIQIRGDLLG